MVPSRAARARKRWVRGLRAHPDRADELSSRAFVTIFWPASMSRFVTWHRTKGALKGRDVGPAVCSDEKQSVFRKTPPMGLKVAFRTAEIKVNPTWNVGGGAPPPPSPPPR